MTPKENYDSTFFNVFATSLAKPCVQIVVEFVPFFLHNCDCVKASSYIVGGCDMWCCEMCPNCGLHKTQETILLFTNAKLLLFTKFRKELGTIAHLATRDGIQFKQYSTTEKATPMLKDFGITYFPCILKFNPMMNQWYEYTGPRIAECIVAKGNPHWKKTIKKYKTPQLN